MATVVPSQAVVIEADRPERERSPVDLLRLTTAVGVVAAILVVEAVFGDTLVSFAAELFSGLSALPAWTVDALIAVARLLEAALLVAGAVAVVRARAWRPVVPIATAGLAAALLTEVFDVFEQPAGVPPLVGGELLDSLGSPEIPTAAWLAALSAAATAAAPWLGRRWRWVSWTAVGALATVRFLATPASLGTLAALLLGWLCGAAAVVGFGGPVRRPRGDATLAGLVAVGVPLVRLEQASLDARGSTPYFGQTATGERLFVKTLGADERSADLLFRLYRRMARRRLGDERPFSTLRRAVEHEALVALAARADGVRTPDFVALARAEPNGFALAYKAVAGRSLDRLAPEEVTDDILAEVWGQLALLRDHRTAHRDLRLANILLGEDGRAWLIDFGFSEMAASDLLLSNDVAELLASSALQVGADRAVARAREATGSATVQSALPRLQPWALSGATRTGLKARPGLLADIRERAAAA